MSVKFTVGLFLLTLFLLPSPVYANESASGFCQQGNQTVALGGLTSSTRVQRSYPSCTVTVYATGTVNLSTIYSDRAGTPLANPFTANANGSWQFYALSGDYDVVLSGGGMATPFTISDISIVTTDRVYCSALSGANFGVQFTAAAALLPSTGGIIDCSNLQGAQTIATDVFTGETKPILLLWPSGTVSSNVTLAPPVTLSIDFGQAGILSQASATTTTIISTVNCPSNRCFTGTGSVVFR